MHFSRKTNFICHFVLLVIVCFFASDCSHYVSMVSFIIPFVVFSFHCYFFYRCCRVLNKFTYVVSYFKFFFFFSLLPRVHSMQGVGFVLDYLSVNYSMNQPPLCTPTCCLATRSRFKATHLLSFHSQNECTCSKNQSNRKIPNTQAL